MLFVTDCLVLIKNSLYEVVVACSIVCIECYYDGQQPELFANMRVCVHVYSLITHAEQVTFQVYTSMNHFYEYAFSHCFFLSERAIKFLLKNVIYIIQAKYM